MRIGIDLGGTNVRMGVVSRDEIKRKITAPCKAQEAEGVVVGQLVEMIGQLISPGVERIGIGVPSVVDAARGIVYDVANIPSWKKVPLKDILEKEFGIPVFVNNDCNCFALGEYHFDEGKGHENLVAIAIGTGVGAGLILNGKLYNGSNTGAGEIGCMQYLQSDYESYCGSNFFIREYGVTAKETYERASRGDEAALAIWEVAGSHIGNLLKAVLFAYDPSAIVLGGSISNAYRFFAPAMTETLHTFPYKETLKHVVVNVAKKEDLGILGASMLGQAD